MRTTSVAISEVAGGTHLPKQAHFVPNDPMLSVCALTEQFPDRDAYCRLQTLSGAVPHAAGRETDSVGFVN